MVRVLRSQDNKCGTVWKRCFHILFSMASTNMTTVMSSVFWIALSLENLHQRSTHKTIEAHGKMLRSIVRQTTLLLNQLGSAKNEERTFKLEDGAAAEEERKGSWQRTSNDVPETELQCLLDRLAMFQKGTPRHRVMHERAKQNKDENPREFQRKAVQVHRKGTAGRVHLVHL